MTTHLTVAVCTWNRAALLEHALRSMTRLAVPAGVTWELVVVDNGSTDRTAGVLSTFDGALPLRCVVEPEPGLSRARNAAVHAARGDYILWTDDDVLVEREWMAAYAEAFASRPGAAVFGGPIEPAFEGSPPRWLTGALASLGNAYALLDLGPDPVPFAADRVPFGANFAVATDAQRRHPYDPELGRSRDRLHAGEETAVVRAMLGEGLAGWWVPGARVRHVIPEARQSLRYLRSYYVGNARSAAWNALTSAPHAPVILGRPRWVWRQAIESELRYRFHRLTRAPSHLWGADFQRASVAWGLLRGMDAQRVHWARLAADVEARGRETGRDSRPATREP